MQGHSYISKRPDMKLTAFYSTYWPLKALYATSQIPPLTQMFTKHFFLLKVRSLAVKPRPLRRTHEPCVQLKYTTLKAVLGVTKLLKMNFHQHKCEVLLFFYVLMCNWVGYLRHSVSSCLLQQEISWIRNNWMRRCWTDLTPAEELMMQHYINCLICKGFKKRLAPFAGRLALSMHQLQFVVSQWLSRFPLTMTFQ